MKTRSERYRLLKQKYEQRRSFFKQKIDSFTSRSMRKTQQQGKQLLALADQLSLDLTTQLNQCTNESLLSKDFNKKLRAFTKAYKHLHAITKPLWRQWAETITIAILLALILRNLLFGLYHVPTGSAEHNILVGDRIWGNKTRYLFHPIKRGDLVIFDSPMVEYDRSSKIAYWWQRYIGFPIPIFGLPAGPDNWVKRVIAIPGDTIEGRMENGKTAIYLNGKKLDEPYVNQFPLIGVRKTRGLIPWEQVGILNVPSFLQYKEFVVHYTYDPSKPFDQQPYYNISENEIVRYPDDQPEMRLPGTPCMDYENNRDVFGPIKLPAGKYWVMGDSRKNSIDSRWWLFLDEERIHGRASFIIYSIDSEEPFWLFDLIKHPINFWLKNVRWTRFFKRLDNYEISVQSQTVS